MANVDFRCERFQIVKRASLDYTPCCFERQCVDIVPYRKAVGSPTDIDYHESSCDNKGQWTCNKRFVQFTETTWDRQTCQFVTDYRIPDNLEYPDYYSTSLDTFLCALDRPHHDPIHARKIIINDEDWGIINLPDSTIP